MITERDDEITKKEIVVEKTNNTENINIVCSKHGIINNGAFYIRYSTIQNDEKKTALDNHNLFCIACLNELYMKFQQEGIIGKISVSMESTDGSEQNVPLEETDITPKEE